MATSDSIKAAAQELYDALAELSDMYVHAWDVADGGLMMMGSSVERFEKAHEAATAALAKARGEDRSHEGK